MVDRRVPWRNIDDKKTPAARESGCDNLDVDVGYEPRQELGVLYGTHDHRLVAAADRDLLLRQRVGGKPRGGTDLVRDDGFAGERLRHVLQSRRDIDGDRPAR